MKLVREACHQSDATTSTRSFQKSIASILSGGQRQRGTTARSTISNPAVLLLDEATSVLDPAAEKIVQSALNKVSINTTNLIIAHKLATVKNAGRTVVMKDGVVFEQCTHLVIQKALGEASSNESGHPRGIVPLFFAQ